MKIPRKLPGVKRREKDLETRVDKAKFVVGTFFRRRPDGTEITETLIQSVYHLVKLYDVPDVARATGFSEGLVRKMVRVAVSVGLSSENGRC